MLISHSDAPAPTPSATTPPKTPPEASPTTSPANSYTPPTTPPSASGDRIRHMLFGNIITVQATIKQLHQLGYANPSDWSQPIATGKINEVTCILIKPIKIES